MTTIQQFTKIMQSSIFRLDGPEIDICTELNVLCECIDKDPTEIDWNMGEFLECTLDSLIIGAFWAMTECHGGQSSDTYETLCVLGEIFKPNMSCGPEDGTGETTAYELICEALLK